MTAPACPHCDRGRTHTWATDGRELYELPSEPCESCRGSGVATCAYCQIDRAEVLAGGTPACSDCNEWLLQDTQRAPQVAS